MQSPLAKLPAAVVGFKLVDDCAAISMVVSPGLRHRIRVATRRQAKFCPNLELCPSSPEVPMVEQPKQSEISNVFGMDHPQHMFVKLGWELNELMKSMSVWKDNEAAPEPLFHAFNTAITAWHVTDWLW